MIENLVLSGGGIRGVSFVGALAALEDKNAIHLAALKTVTGTSAGAMLGTLIALGFTISEIWSFVYHSDFSKLIQPSFMLLSDHCGMETGEQVFLMFEKILFSRTKVENIDFQQLFELTQIHLTLVGTCVNTKQAVYFDHVQTPTFKVAMALRISMGIPFIFTPITIHHLKYVDGGLTDNYPIQRFEHDLDKTLGLLICSDCKTDFTYPEQYICILIALMIERYFCVPDKKYHEHTIFIHPDESVNSCTFTFNLTDAEKQASYRSGYESAIKYIDSHHDKLMRLS